jgi:hypothetical protein
MLSSISLAKFKPYSGRFVHKSRKSEERRLKCRLQEMRPTTPVKTGLLLRSIQPSVQALSPDLSDCRNKGLRDIGLLNTRWYLSRNEEASIVIVGNHAGKPCRQEELDTKHWIGSSPAS